MVDKYAREQLGQLAAVEKIIDDPRAISLKNMFLIGQHVLGWAALTTEVFTRFLFGRRYVGFIPTLIPALLLGSYTAALKAYHYRWQPTAVYLGFYLLAALFHKGVAWYIRYKERAPLYTRFFGFPLVGLLLRIDKYPSRFWWAYRLSACLPIALGLELSLTSPTLGHPIEYGLGVWLVFAGCSEAFRSHLVYVQECDREDEREDGKILAENEQKALAGQPITKTAGIARVVRPPMVVGGTFDFSGESITSGARTSQKTARPL